MLNIFFYTIQVLILCFPYLYLSCHLTLQATWHKGHSLAQTVYSCLYLLRPERTSSNALLHSYCQVIRATCKTVLFSVSDARTHEVKYSNSSFFYLYHTRILFGVVAHWISQILLLSQISNSFSTFWKKWLVIDLFLITKLLYEETSGIECLGFFTFIWTSLYGLSFVILICVTRRLLTYMVMLPSSKCMTHRYMALVVWFPKRVPSLFFISCVFQHTSPYLFLPLLWDHLLTEQFFSFYF